MSRVKLLMVSAAIVVILLVIGSSSLTSVHSTSIWPPVGTRVVYDCSAERVIVVRNILESHPELLSEIYEYLYGSKPSIGDQVDPRLLNEVYTELRNRRLALDCTLTWEIVDYRDNLYRIRLSMNFSLVKLLYDETGSFKGIGDTVYKAKYRVEKEVLVDENRNMFVEGRNVGVWPFFLMPWELDVKTIHNLSMFTSLKYYEINQTLVRELLKYKPQAFLLSTKPSRPEVMKLLDKLGIEAERALEVTYRVAFISEKLQGEKREEVIRKLEGIGMNIASISMEDATCRSLKAVKNIYCDPQGEALPVSIDLVYDTMSGILLFYYSMVVLDPFYTVLNLEEGSLQLLFFPSIISMEVREIKLGGITEGGVGVSETSPYVMTYTGNTITDGNTITGSTPLPPQTQSVTWVTVGVSKPSIGDQVSGEGSGYVGVAYPVEKATGTGVSYVVRIGGLTMTVIELATLLLLVLTIVGLLILARVFRR